MEHCQIKINTISPRVSKSTVVETYKQPAGIEVTQSLNVVITTIGVDMVVKPNMNVVRRGIFIGSIVNLDHGLGGFSTGKSLNRSSRLLAKNIRVVGTP
jgi:hypothetical protein